jgi:Uncharacterized phage-encoded protein
MNQLAYIKQDDVFTDTQLISEASGNEHESIVSLLKKYRSDFEESGALRFSDLKSGNSKGGRPMRVYLLNEEQATLLVTYLDNTPIVRGFKKELVHQFVAMRRLLLEQQSADWQQMRITAKGNRLHTTEAIRELVEYAKAQGSKHADMLYTVYSKLIKQMSECTSRDFASTETLSTIICLERIITGVIWQEMSRNTHYKAIYQRAKDELTNLVSLWAIPKLTA